jgi:hypothetical protein
MIESESRFSQMTSGLSAKRSIKLKLHKPHFLSIHSKNSENKVYNHCPNTMPHYSVEDAFNLIVCSHILRKVLDGIENGVLAPTAVAVRDQQRIIVEGAAQKNHEGD